MIVGRIIGWILVTAAVAIFARDILASIDSGALAMMSTGELWFRLHNGSLNLAQAITQRYLFPSLWDPVIVTILIWPATVVLGVPGMILVRLCRRRPRKYSMFR
jgi:hypothetical protein